jgi:hypothetical protein
MMGRLAGPLSRESQLKDEQIFREIELRRRQFFAATPLIHPPAARRQMALLWLVSNHHMEFHVGVENRPPLTADMQMLLRKGYLRMERRRPPTFWAHPRRRSNLYNRLSLTPVGLMVLARAKVSEADKDYIQRAQKTGVMR